MAAFANHVGNAQLHEFAIELDKRDACFFPGSNVSGRLVLRAKMPLEVEKVKVMVYGNARLKAKPGIEFINTNIDLITTIEKIAPEKAVFVPFNETLPDDVVTSLETKSVSALYTVRADITFRTEENETKHCSAVKGFTVVEPFDLNRLPACYFEPAIHVLSKKFGLFSCTGGHIKLNFTISRTAFVCGENISIEGKIENKTDRRIDKVVAVLQQVNIVSGQENDLDSTTSETSVLDVSDIHEDNLALFVDEGQAIRIERNFAIPVLPPSTMLTEVTSVENAEHRNSLALANKPRRMSLSASLLNMNNHPKFPSVVPSGSRFLKTLYQLSVKVKTGGIEVMEINVPIIIGTVPYMLALPKTLDDLKEKDKEKLNKPLSEDEQTVTYRESRKDKPIVLSVSGDTYTCNKSQLNFINKYPFFANLPTSSKQSRKVKMLANAIKAESGFLQGVGTVDDTSSYSSEMTVHLPNMPLDY